MIKLSDIKPGDKNPRIKLTKGKYAIVDPEDYEFLNQFKWYAQKNRNHFCAARKEYINGSYRLIYMHRLILNISDGQIFVDHINHDGLDNRRVNLRQCTHQENIMNMQKQNGFTSKYKGVSWYRKLSRWRAKICINSKSIHIGYFYSEEEAARAYNAAASYYFGQFGFINII